MIKSIKHYIVEPIGGEYVNEKDGIIVNAGIENHKYVNRLGKVISKPEFDKSDLMVGDTCVVHHNCFRTYYGMKGEEKKSSEYFRENTYLIPLEKIYLYKRNEYWKPIHDYCFVKPVDFVQDTDIYVPKKEEEHVGIVMYSNSNEFEKGDKVAFKKNREYEFEINDEKLYRMKNKDIVVKFN